MSRKTRIIVLTNLILLIGSIQHLFGNDNLLNQMTKICGDTAVFDTNVTVDLPSFYNSKNFDISNESIDNKENSNVNFKGNQVIVYQNQPFSQIRTGNNDLNYGTLKYDNEIGLQKIRYKNIKQFEAKVKKPEPSLYTEKI